MAKKRPNIIPIIEDARHPQKYRMLVPMVDVVFAGELVCSLLAIHSSSYSGCVYWIQSSAYPSRAAGSVTSRLS